MRHMNRLLNSLKAERLQVKEEYLDILADFLDKKEQELAVKEIELEFRRRQCLSNTDQKQHI